MSNHIDDTEVELVTIALDAVTAARLRNLANMCHAAPTSVAASLLHDVLKDDDEHHEPAARAVSIN